jgi:dihydropyrimidinase
MFRYLAKGTNKYLQSYLLKNAKVVNSDFSFKADVLLEDGKIAGISDNLTHKTATVIDCTNKLVIPGGIDTHTHMQLPFMGTFAADDFDQGTKAAIAGGTTSFIDFAIPNKGESLSSAFQTWRNWADPKVNCDYGLHSAIVEWNG